MTAPTRSAYYWDHGTTEAGEPPEQGGPWLIDSLVWTARYFPDWMMEGQDLAISVRDLAEYEKTGAGRIGFSARGVAGEIVLTMDPSGWILVVASIGSDEVFRGYLDRPWEQLEIWPVGATPGPQDEAPGRIGKRQTWLGLAVTDWPRLRPLAGGLEAVMFEVDEEKLRTLMNPPAGD